MENPLSRPEDAKELLNAVNGLRRDAMIFIVVMAVLILSYFIIKMLVSFRKAQNMEDAKERRASMYAQSLNQVSSTSTLLSRVVGDMKAAVELLAAKITGRINYADSRRMIEHRFLHDVKNDMCRELARSFAEDDFEKRKDHIERLVKTNIGRILSEAREHLCMFNMSLNAASFFECVAERKNIERFVLCEMVWEKILPLYSRDLSLKLKIEEAQILVDNTIQDYISQLMSIHGADAYPA